VTALKENEMKLDTVHCIVKRRVKRGSERSLVMKIGATFAHQNLGLSY
jgi:hypothetical protein